MRLESEVGEPSHVRKDKDCEALCEGASRSHELWEDGQAGRGVKQEQRDSLPRGISTHRSPSTLF